MAPPQGGPLIPCVRAWRAGRPDAFPIPDPTAAARTAKHMTAVVFHQDQPPKDRRAIMAATTLIPKSDSARFELLPVSSSSHRCILALNLGTTTGWALRGHDGLITSGTASFRPGRFDGGGMRYLRFTNWLGELDRLSGPPSFNPIRPATRKLRPQPADPCARTPRPDRHLSEARVGLTGCHRRNCRTADSFLSPLRYFPVTARAHRDGEL